MATVEYVMSSGHGKYVSGAADILNEVIEARKVVNQVAKYLEVLKEKVEVYHDDTTRSQRDNVNGIVRYHNKFTRKRDVSVHFNAGGSKDKPVGVEVLYYSDNMKAEAAKMSAAIAKASGLKDRGPKQRKDLGFLKGTEEKAMLIEVCFVDSKVDAELYKKNFLKICEAIAETLSGKKLPVYKEPVKPVAKPSGEKHQVIAGTFNDKENAKKMAEALKKAGFDSYVK